MDRLKNNGKPTNIIKPDPALREIGKKISLRLKFSGKTYLALHLKADKSLKK